MEVPNYLAEVADMAVHIENLSRPAGCQDVWC